MTTKVLSIISTPYRATVEEQDDTILWFTSMCSTAGLDVTVLLESGAVSYLVRGQDASGLRFGAAEVVHPPRLDEDLEDLLARGVPVRYVADDAAERGIAGAGLVPGATPVDRAALPALFADFDQVWRW